MSAHWSSIQENTAVLGIRILYRIHQLTGRRVFQIALFPVVACYWLALPRVRRVSRDYLRHLHAAYPECPAPSAANSLRHVFRFADTILDKLLAAAGHFSKEDLEVTGAEELNADPRGVILVTAHTGCTEAGRALLGHFTGRRVRILTHTQHARTFNTILERLHPGFNDACMQVGEITPAAALALKDSIDRGDFVVIAGDRTPIHSMAEQPVPFLGEDALLPTGAYILGTILQAPVWTMICTRSSDGHARYRFAFEKLWEPHPVKRGERSELFGRIARAYAGALARTLRECPYDWFNFFDFWDKEQKK